MRFEPHSNSVLITAAATLLSFCTALASAQQIVTVTISSAASRIASATHHQGEIPSSSPNKAQLPPRAALASSAIPATEPIRLAASSGTITVFALGLAAISRNASVYFCATK